MYSYPLATYVGSVCSVLAIARGCNIYICPPCYISGFSSDAYVAEPKEDDHVVDVDEVPYPFQFPPGARKYCMKSLMDTCIMLNATLIGMWYT